MTKSSPSDLSVAFRSLPGRLSQASTDDAPRTAIESATVKVQAAITAAATQLGAVATGEGVAAAIEHRHVSEWTDTFLEDLQRQADLAARAIRDLEDLAEPGR